MMLDGHTYINIDAQHIKASSPRLLAATVESPEDMVLLWDEALNRLAREQTDSLEEMGLQAPEDTIQVGWLLLLVLWLICATCVCWLPCCCGVWLLWGCGGQQPRAQTDLLEEMGCRHPRTPSRWVVTSCVTFLFLQCDMRIGCCGVWLVLDEAVNRLAGADGPAGIDAYAGT
jgi:hypothetical protein